MTVDVIATAKLKTLSLKQAQRCEDACEPVCKCRCGGTAHGKGRGVGAGFFNGLPEDDPHYIPTKEAKAAKKRREADERKRRRYEALAAVRGPYDR